MSTTVRHSEQEDIAAIHAIYAQPSNTACTLQLPYPSIELWRSRLGGQRDNFYSLVACRDAHVVGHIGIDTFVAPRRKHAANVGLGVDETARRSGVGTALMSAALELCHNWLAVSRVELETYTDNAAAIALFRKHGFVIEGTAKGYAFRAGHYVDVHLMAHMSAARIA